MSSRNIMSPNSKSTCERCILSASSKSESPNLRLRSREITPKNNALVITPPSSNIMTGLSKRYTIGPSYQFNLSIAIRSERTVSEGA